MKTLLREKFVSWWPQIKVAAKILAFWTAVAIAVTVALGPSLRCLENCDEAVPRSNTYNSRFMHYQILSGDVGPLGQKLYAAFWFAPLVPPWLMLMLAVDSCFFATRSRSGSYIPRLPFSSRLAVFVLLALLYTILARLTLAARGMVTIMIISAMATAAGGTIQWMITRSAHKKLPLPFDNTSTVPANGWLFIVGIVLAHISISAATLFVTDSFDVRRSLTEMSAGLDAAADARPGKPPLLYEPILSRIEHRPLSADSRGWSQLKAQRRATVANMLTALSGSGAPSAATMREVRAAVTELTSGQPNSITQNCCRAAWYVALTIVCVGLAVLGLRGHAPWVRLLLVASSFVAIGLTFGVIYYDYYILDAARYNALVEIAQVTDPAVMARLNDPSSKEPDSGAHYIRNFQQNLSTNGSALYAMQSGFFASSVFAQDSPQVAQEADAPDKFEPVGYCSVQFDVASSTLGLHTPLAYSYLPSTSTFTPVRDECVASVLSGDSQASRNRASAVGETNLTSLTKIAAALCGETLRQTQKDDRGYAARVVAGADCTGLPDANNRLSSDRARSLRIKITSMLDKIDHLRPTAISVTTLLRRAFIQANVETYPQRTKLGSDACDDDAVQLLWQYSDKRHLADPEAKPGRAAFVEITRRTANLEGRVHMQTGLTENSTLSDMVYFSFVTFTTTGYGDMKAVSGPVRFCVIVENILELLFTAIFFAAAMAVVTRE